MIVGIPQECKNNEYRVSLIPQQIAAIAQTHKVIVQQDAGLGAGFSNEDYIRSGAIMVSSMEDVYAQANLIIKVKEPLPQEYALIKPQHTLFTFFHFAASLTLTEAMLKSGATCIAYETIEDSKGGLPLLAPMSEVAGRLAGQQAAKYLEKPQGGSGILVGGVTGVAPAKALVLGGGVVGTSAAAVLVGMGAARKHIVAYGYFMSNEHIPHPLVNPFVMSAENNNILKQRERIGHPLIEYIAIGCHINHRIVVAFCF